MSQVFWILLWAGVAHGQPSCLPDFTALQTIEVLKSTDHSFAYPLASKGPAGEFTTRVRAEGRMIDGKALSLRFLFDPTFDGVSLPYNLFAVMVLVDGVAIGYHDFTNACTSPGLSFFPGRIIEMPVVKFPHAGAERLQVMVWGKI